MTYELTDTNDALIKIGPTISNDQVFVQIRDIEISIAGYIRNEDAPAVALAILEAADVGKLGKVRLVAALSQLAQYQEDRRRETEREAEDAKVREFRESSMTAIATVFNESSADSKDWGRLSETNREGWRARYRAARRFFEGS